MTLNQANQSKCKSKYIRVFHSWLRHYSNEWRAIWNGGL